MIWLSIVINHTISYKIYDIISYDTSYVIILYDLYYKFIHYHIELNTCYINNIMQHYMIFIVYHNN